MEDTTQRDFTWHQAALDLGRIGDDGGRGVFVHSTLAPRPVNVVEVREINPPG